ncbi:MAG: hypothetical protein EOO39_46410, partial [Cytophagaceae bacterium]
ANTSTLVASPNAVVANGTSTATLTFTAIDAYNNLVPGTAVSLSASGGNNTFGATSGTTNSSGIFTTTLASTLAQFQTVTASFGSTNTVTTSVQFVSGPASATTSSFVVSPNSTVANNSNVLTGFLTLLDAQKNALVGITPTFTASGTNTTISSAGPTTGAGQTSATFSTPSAQNENILAAAGSLIFSVPVSFVAGPISQTSSSLVANPNASYGNGTASVALTTTARDAQGNAVSGAPVTLSASGGNNTFGATSGTTTAAGTFATTLKSTIVQNETITATLNGNITESTSVNFAQGANLTKSTFTVSATSQTVGPSNSITATVTLKDAQSNALANIAPTWTATGSNTTIAQSGNTNASGVMLVPA